MTEFGAEIREESGRTVRLSDPRVRAVRDGPDLSALCAAGFGGVDRLLVFLTPDLRVDLMGERLSAVEEEKEEEDGSPEASV